MRNRRRPTRRTGFTLIELLVAGVISALVLGSVAFSLSNLTSSRIAGKRRMLAYLRADAALETMRRDITSIMRKSDLFYTLLVIENDDIATDWGILDRDMILVFSTKLRPIHEIDYAGEGMEFETQYRVIEDQLGPVLWQRSDPVPEEFYEGGGVATPVVEGVVSIHFEAYDGEDWWPEWDSDIDGLPHAILITVIASGHRQGEDAFAANMPKATLRTIIPIDRVPPPPVEPEEEEEDPAADEELPEGEVGPGGGGFGSGVGSGGSDAVPLIEGDGVRRPGAPGGGRGGGRGDGRGRGSSGGGGRGSNNSGGSQSTSDQRIFGEN